jgi:hypothetical protein
VKHPSPAGTSVDAAVAAAHRAGLAAGFTDALHVVGVVLAALSTVGAVLTFRALAPRRDGCDT